MLLYAIVLFALAAVIGVYMITRVFAGVTPPWAAAIFHGLFATSGLLLLLYAAFASGTQPALAVTVAAGLLVVAALGGFVMLTYHARKQPPPKALASIHALAAVAGFLSLCGSVFGII
jgi:hypothetical protein